MSSIDTKIAELAKAMDKKEREITARAEECTSEARKIVSFLRDTRFVNHIEVSHPEDPNCGISWSGDNLLFHEMEEDGEVTTSILLGASRIKRIKALVMLPILVDRAIEIIQETSK